MASFLLSECLENIFQNFIKHPSSDTRAEIFTKDLYSCTLVSRYWCRISTPFLYAYPFHYLNFKNYDNLWSPSNAPYYKLIRTLLGCIPQSELKQIYMSYAQALSTKHIPLNEKVSYSSFNYISFIRGFILNEMILESQNVYYYKNIWLSAHNSEKISLEKTIRTMNHLIKFICKHCRSLTMLEFPFSMKYSSVINLSQFISSISLQKKLQHISLVGWHTPELTADYSNVFNLLSMQSVSLRILEFNNLSFDGIDEKVLNSLCLLKNIRVLRLHACNRINNLISWAKNLTKLEVFEIVDYYFISADILIQLFQSSSNSLTKLVIKNNNYLICKKSQDFIQIFQQIPLYLHSLSHLELPILLPAELISIFKSCTKLVYLSVMLNDEEDLKGLGRFVPKILESIEFKLSMNESSFKKSLGCFLKEYIIIDGALKYLEFRNYILGGIATTKWYDEWFDGIQITAYYL